MGKFDSVSGLRQFLAYNQKDKVNFKIYDVGTWKTNNYNIRIAQVLRK